MPDRSRPVVRPEKTRPVAPNADPSNPAARLIRDDHLMSFGDHLEELRRRVLFSIAGIVPLLAGAFLAGRPILSALIAPAREQLAQGGQVPRLLATAPAETFGAVVHLAMVITLLLGAPWLLYQLWLFVAPGLYEYEKRFVRLLVPMSAVLTASSVVFVYFAIMPVVLAFFIGYSNDVSDVRVPVVAVPEGVVIPTYPVLAGDPADPTPGQVWVNSAVNQLRVCTGVGEDKVPIVSGTELVMQTGIVQQYRISEYIKMFLNISLGFGVGFQMPVVVLLLGWLGVVEPKDFARWRKHVCVVCFIAAAILTPVDPISMMLLGVPLYGLFELGVFMLRVLPAERVAGAAREPADAGDE